MIPGEPLWRPPERRYRLPGTPLPANPAVTTAKRLSLVLVMVLWFVWVFVS